jgi:hypothetical protein
MIPPPIELHVLLYGFTHQSLSMSCRIINALYHIQSSILLSPSPSGLAWMACSIVSASSSLAEYNMVTPTINHNLDSTLWVSLQILTHLELEHP